MTNTEIIREAIEILKDVRDRGILSGSKYVRRDKEINKAIELLGEIVSGTNLAKSYTDVYGHYWKPDIDIANYLLENGKTFRVVTHEFLTNGTYILNKDLGLVTDINPICNCSVCSRVKKLYMRR